MGRCSVVVRLRNECGEQMIQECGEKEKQESGGDWEKNGLGQQEGKHYQTEGRSEVWRKNFKMGKM